MRDRGADDQLPVQAVLGELRAALDDRGAAVLVAPPGTGKTTGVPPALLGERWATGRIVVLEPRRLAARTAASRMAQVAGEQVGQTYGYAVRGERRGSARTRVEVVTEGLLVRRLQSDPSLDGISAVLLDEFHERSIDTDLALALLLDLRGSLRPDLRILVMSATLDPTPVATLLADERGPVPVVEATSPMHPVEVRYRPGSAHDPLERRVAAVVAEAVANDPGDVLVFLPGRPEIRRTARELGRVALPGGVQVHELHGSLPTAEQDEVIRPHPGGQRRIVLSTSLAETSITVPGVRVVVDAGRRRTVRTDPRSGLPTLTTTAVSTAGAAQRSGRAGRTAAGVSYRLWSAEDERHRPHADPPELLTGDLSALLLQLLAWGVDSPDDLAWLDPPPDSSLDAAADLLQVLGALDRGRLSPRGRELAAIGFHPRLAAVALSGRELGAPGLAAEVAAVLEAGRAGETDLLERLRALRAGPISDELRRALRDWRRALDTGDHAAASAAEQEEAIVGRLLLAGYPDRVARRRSGTRRDERGNELAVFHLRAGGEVVLRCDHPLARAAWLVVAALDAGAPGQAGRAHLAVSIDEVAVRERLADHVITREDVRWDRDRGDVVARRVTSLGAITLGEEPLRHPDPARVTEAVVGALRSEGLALLGRLGEADALRARVGCLLATDVESGGSPWPDWSDAALLESLEEWLGPWLDRVRTRKDLDRVDVRGALDSRLDHLQRRRLDELAPSHWQLASGRRVPLRYGEVDGEPGTVLASVRLRDALGTDVHPTVGAGRLPVTVELLSPAGRPVQRTTDLPGFWRGSYAAVRSELRGRYPKHPWPERPWEPLPRR